MVEIQFVSCEDVSMFRNNPFLRFLLGKKCRTHILSHSVLGSWVLSKQEIYSRHTAKTENGRRDNQGENEERLSECRVQERGI